MKTIMTGLAAAGLTAAAHAAPATPETARAALEGAGATAMDATTGSGSHVIDATLAENGLNFSIRLGNCGEDQQCGYALIFATFTLEDVATAERLEKTNAYNDSFPFGRAFVIPGDESRGDIVGVDYTLDLTGDAQLDSSDVDTFKQVVNSFLKHWKGD